MYIQLIERALPLEMTNESTLSRSYRMLPLISRIAPVTFRKEPCFKIARCPYFELLFLIYLDSIMKTEKFSKWKKKYKHRKHQFALFAVSFSYLESCSNENIARKENSLEHHQSN